MANEFEALCDLLPADVHWGDLLTPAIVAEIAMAAESKEREACAKVCSSMADGCRAVNGWASPEMMSAYKYAEEAILKRSNDEVQRDARQGGSAGTTGWPAVGSKKGSK